MKLRCERVKVGMYRRRGHRWVAYGALIVLIAQSWLAPLALAGTAARENAVIICTSAGYRVLDLADDLALSPQGPGEKPTQDDGTSLTCAACLFHAVGKILMPGQTARFAPTLRPAPQATPSDDRPRHRILRGVPHSRDPPAV